MFLVGWSAWKDFPLVDECPIAGALLVTASTREEAADLVKQLLVREGYEQIIIHKVDRVHNPNSDGVLAEVSAS